jgi:hypothetical protein
MKKMLAIVSLVAVSVSSGLAQGEFAFANRNLGIGLNTPITLNGAVDGLNGPAYAVDVFLASDLTTPLASVDFVASAAGAGYFSGGSVAVPGIAADQTVSLILRGYDTATDGATAVGFSQPFDVVLGGGGGITLPGAFTDLQAFDVQTVVVPEPSTIAMIALGLGAVALRFRRK